MSEKIEIGRFKDHYGSSHRLEVFQPDVMNDRYETPEFSPDILEEANFFHILTYQRSTTKGKRLRRTENFLVMFFNDDGENIFSFYLPCENYQKSSSAKFSPIEFMQVFLRFGITRIKGLVDHVIKPKYFNEQLELALEEAPVYVLQVSMIIPGDK